MTAHGVYEFDCIYQSPIYLRRDERFREKHCPHAVTAIGAKVLRRDRPNA